MAEGIDFPLVQAITGVIILVSLYGREPHVRTTI